jgi:hypothetical protein
MSESPYPLIIPDSKRVSIIYDIDKRERLIGFVTSYARDPTNYRRLYFTNYDNGQCTLMLVESLCTRLVGTGYEPYKILDISHDGSTLLLLSVDGTSFTHNVYTKQERTFPVHEVGGGAFSGSYVYLLDSDHKQFHIVKGDIVDNVVLPRNLQVSNIIRSMSSGLLFIDLACGVYQIDATGYVKFVFKIHINTNRFMAIGEDKFLLFDDDSIDVYDIKTKTIVASVYSIPEDPLTCVNFQPLTGRVVYTTEYMGIEYLQIPY